MKQSDSSQKSSKKWLREASMQRMSTFMKNKTEQIGNASQLGMGVIDAEEMEKSGLSSCEIGHLEQWIGGHVTGRHCMLAILDSRLNEKDIDSVSGSASSLKMGDLASSDSLPIELIRTSVHLPENFLCDSGYIYDTVFKRPPTSVIREALQMLSNKALEKNALTLNVHQINIAIKQLRLDNIVGSLNTTAAATSEESSETPIGDENNGDTFNTTITTGDNTAKLTSPTTKTKVPTGGVNDNNEIPSTELSENSSENSFRLQIMIELIRMHVINNNNKLKATHPAVLGGNSDRKSPFLPNAASTNASTDAKAAKNESFGDKKSSYKLPNWSDFGIHTDSDSDKEDSSGSDSDSSVDSLDELFFDLPPEIQAELKRHRPKKVKKVKPPKTKKNADPTSSTRMAAKPVGNKAENDIDDGDEEDDSKKSQKATKLDISAIEHHLNTPLQTIQETAAGLTSDDIEESNSLLKPYLKQLASLKAILTIQLKDLVESRAYLSLGLTADATDAQIKKAYRMMAIKLHPDKPGGSTVKFQQLQDHYHEIIRTRKETGYRGAGGDEDEEDIAAELKSRMRQSAAQKAASMFEKSTRTAATAAAASAADKGTPGPTPTGGASKTAGNSNDENESEDEGDDDDDDTDDIDFGDPLKKMTPKPRSFQSKLSKAKADDTEADSGSSVHDDGRDEDEEDDEEMSLNTSDEELMSGKKKAKATRDFEELNKNDGDEILHSSPDDNDDADAASDEDDVDSDSDSFSDMDLDELLRRTNDRYDRNSGDDNDDEDHNHNQQSHNSRHSTPHSGIESDIDRMMGSTSNSAIGNGSTKQTTSGTASAFDSEKVRLIAESVNSDAYIKEKKALVRHVMKSEYDTPAEQAQDIADAIFELISIIKSAANEITQLAQYNVKLQKNISRANMKLKHPASVIEIMKHITGNTAKGGADITPDIELCSLYTAIGPIELICELTQNICSYAMELPNVGTSYYARYIANHSVFLSTIESTMNKSLNTLKTTIRCVESTEQLNNAIKRVKESYILAIENEEISKLIIEMISTSLKSNILTITNTVDQIVEAAVNVSTIYELITQIIRDTETYNRNEIKKNRAAREHMEQENDYCEEDKELLRQSRAQRQAEEAAARDAQRQQQQSSSENGKNPDGTPAGTGENNKDSASNDPFDSSTNSLNELKDKIRQLQIQLRVQHITTLQTMNKEIITLQSSILTEIKGLPFIQSFETLFKQPVKSKHSHHKHSHHKNDFYTSLMSLLADFIDSSCSALRTDFAATLTSPAFTAATTALTTTDASGGSGNSNNSGGRDQTERALILKHLGWMSIVLSDGTGDLFSEAILKKVLVAPNAPSAEGENHVPAHDNHSNSSDNNTNSTSTLKTRLALIPDFKSKTLYLASLVDMATVQDIIAVELLQRVEEILIEARSQYAKKVAEDGQGAVKQITVPTPPLHTSSSRLPAPRTIDTTTPPPPAPFSISKSDSDTADGVDMPLFPPVPPTNEKKQQQQQRQHGREESMRNAPSAESPSSPKVSPQAVPVPSAPEDVLNSSFGSIDLTVKHYSASGDSSPARPVASSPHCSGEVAVNSVDELSAFGHTFSVDTTATVNAAAAIAADSVVDELAELIQGVESELDMSFRAYTDEENKKTSKDVQSCAFTVAGAGAEAEFDIPANSGAVEEEEKEVHWVNAEDFFAQLSDSDSDSDEDDDEEIKDPYNEGYAGYSEDKHDYYHHSRSATDDSHKNDSSNSNSTFLQNQEQIDLDEMAALAACFEEDDDDGDVYVGEGEYGVAGVSEGYNIDDDDDADGYKAYLESLRRQSSDAIYSNHHNINSSDRNSSSNGNDTAAQGTVKSTATRNTMLDTLESDISINAEDLQSYDYNNFLAELRRDAFIAKYQVHDEFSSDYTADTTANAVNNATGAYPYRGQHHSDNGSTEATAATEASSEASDAIETSTRSYYGKDSSGGSVFGSMYPTTASKNDEDDDDDHSDSDGSHGHAHIHRYYGEGDVDDSVLYAKYVDSEDEDENDDDADGYKAYQARQVLQGTAGPPRQSTAWRAPSSTTEPSVSSSSTTRPPQTNAYLSAATAIASTVLKEAYSSRRSSSNSSGSDEMSVFGSDTASRSGQISGVHYDAPMAPSVGLDASEEEEG